MMTANDRLSVTVGHTCRYEFHTGGYTFFRAFYIGQLLKHSVKAVQPLSVAMTMGARIFLFELLITVTSNVSVCTFMVELTSHIILIAVPTATSVR